MCFSLMKYTSRRPIHMEIEMIEVERNERERSRNDREIETEMIDNR